MNRIIYALPFAALAMSGCASSLRQCRLVSGSGAWRDGQYDLQLVLNNTSETESVEVPKLTFRVTAYDEHGEIVSEDRHVEAEAGESLAPLDLTRIHLRVPDENARVRRCRVVLQDESGRVICEYAVDADDDDAPAAGQSVFSASDFSIR